MECASLLALSRPRRTRNPRQYSNFDTSDPGFAYPIEEMSSEKTMKGILYRSTLAACLVLVAITASAQP